MPELPDITLYLEALEQRLAGQVLRDLQLLNPFLLRTAVPPISSAPSRRIVAFRRLGKRLALGLEDDLWLVLHLMIAGRLHWAAAPSLPRGKMAAQLARFRFDSGTLYLTEAGSKRRASLHLVQGEHGLALLNPGGIEVLECSLEQFTSALTRENHTLKRSLTDPRLFSGIGNAFSDEILHAARLSPVTLTARLAPPEIARLFHATRDVLTAWTQRLRLAARGEFPANVTAFRPEMAVHGKFGQPCPVCHARVQRIRYAENETNYCPTCQTGGKLLADRSLSLLLKRDWPKTAEELEELKASR